MPKCDYCALNRLTKEGFLTRIQGMSVLIIADILIDEQCKHY